MSSINGNSVTVFKGRMIAASRSTRIDEGSVGVDGEIVIRGAWKTDICRIHTAVEVSGTIATARALIEVYRALMSGTSTVTVVDSLGETWSNVAVIGVTAVPDYTIVGGVLRVTADWLLLPEAVAL